MNYSYLRDSERFGRECPRTYRAIHGKRFLLPQYRQVDYFNQERANAELELGLLATAMGFLGYKDDVHRAMYVNYCGGLKCDRPTFFLEKELGGPLFESALPEEMKVEDIVWPWPQFRVFLPLGLLTIEREGVVRSLTYLDICRVPAGERFGLPTPYAEEVEGYIRTCFPEAYGDPNRVPVTGLRMDEGEPYVALAGGLDWRRSESEGSLSYASVISWTDKRIGEVLAMESELATPFSIDDLDRVFLEKMLRLSLNILLFISQKPLFYKPEIVRALKQEGKHHIKPALARAHFVGAERFRRAAELLDAAKKKAAAHAATTGHHLPAHWRKGHWKRQPYGPKHTLRRWQWISIYHTFGLDGLGPGGDETGKGN